MASGHFADRRLSELVVRSFRRWIRGWATAFGALALAFGHVSSGQVRVPQCRSAFSAIVLTPAEPQLRNVILCLFCWRLAYSCYETYVLAGLHALDLFAKSVLPCAEAHFFAFDRSKSGDAALGLDEDHWDGDSSSDDESDLHALVGDVRATGANEIRTKTALQLHSVLLSLSKLKDGTLMQSLCKAAGAAAPHVAQLNVSHRARRIVDVITELQRRFMESSSRSRHSKRR